MMLKGLTRLLKLYLPLIPLIILPQRLNSYHAYFWSHTNPNIIKNRVFIQRQISNKPCQDRSAQIQFTHINGFAVAVFDGHGGWQVSQLCKNTLLKKLDQFIGINKNTIFNQQQLITKSLRDAFQSVQTQFLKAAKQGYKYGFGRFARVGSCALVCVISNNKIYSANAGDSLGLIIQQDQNRSIKYIDINRQLNANNIDQQNRLKKLFPNQSDIVVCKNSNTKSCYVKSRLQPTRSLGDLRLKHKQFNNPDQISTDHDYQQQLTTFTGPYISWEPQIKVFPLKKNFKSIVIASDGLWDELNRKQVAQLFKNRDSSKMPKLLIDKALQRAAQNANMTVKTLKQIPQGKKRKLHDDITVVVVNLQGQFQK